MSEKPIRLLDQPGLPMAERALLEAGLRQAPISYDIAAGAARFEASLAKLSRTDGAGGEPPASAGAASPWKWLGGKLGPKWIAGLMLSGAAIVSGVSLRAEQDGRSRFEAMRPAADREVAAETASAPAGVSEHPGVNVSPAVAPAVVVTAPRASTNAIRRRTRRSRDDARLETERAVADLARPPHASSPASPSMAATQAPEVDDTNPMRPAPTPQEPTAAAATAGELEDTKVTRPPPTPPRPAPLRVAPRDSVATDEMSAVARARSLVDRDPEAALRLLEQIRQRYQNGYLVEERRALVILALVRAGRWTPAREQAQAFLRDYPNSPLLDRIQAALRR